MRAALSLAGRDLCVIEIWADKAPRLAEALRLSCPLTSILQHGKIVGDLAFFSLPVVLPPENAAPLQDIVRERRRLTGSAAGTVCFYAPRQQICIYYGDDLCDEPFALSHVGEIVSGAMEMRLAGIALWSAPGAAVTLRLLDEAGIAATGS